MATATTAAGVLMKAHIDLLRYIEITAGSLAMFTAIRRASSRAWPLIAGRWPLAGLALLGNDRDWRGKIRWRD